MQDKAPRWIRQSTGMLFLATATALFISAETNRGLEQPHDPFFFLHLRIFFWILGGLCLGVGIVNTFCKMNLLWVGCGTWTVTAFIIYRLGYLWMGGRSLAGYMGNLSDAFGISARTAGLIADLVLLCLFFGSYATLVCALKQKSSKGTRNRQTMFCSSCGGHISFDTRNAGQKVPCPHCKANVTLCKPEENLKVACYFCKGHIEFPPHAIGEKLQCPHCKMGITLKEPAAV